MTAGTPPTGRPAGEVTAFAAQDIERTTQLRVVPMCWYVADWFERNPEHTHLLRRGL